MPSLEGKGDQEHAYCVWVSEVMLQQTRVATVIAYFEKWMTAFPNVKALARADIEAVNSVWAGLGYYRRAANLHKGAKEVEEKFNGDLPNSSGELVKISGIGRYTAGAIASIVFGERVPSVDGNVIRVLSRLRAIGSNPKASSSQNLYWKIAEDLITDEKTPGAFNQALMELGATVCLPRNPLCNQCPTAAHCKAYQMFSSGIQDIEDECEFCGDVALPLRSVCDYPMKVKKTAPRKETLVVFILQFSNSSEDKADKYLLFRRPDEGLLANMWEFPNIIVENDDKHKYRSKAKASILLKENFPWAQHWNPVQSTFLGTVGHVFSHIVQTLCVFWFHFGDTTLDKLAVASTLKAQYVTRKDIKDLACPKPVSKCLKLLDDYHEATNESSLPKSQTSILQFCKRN